MSSDLKLPQERLQTLVRERLDSAQLELAISATLYAGPGTNALCVVCLQPITPQQIAYEAAISSTRSLEFHIQCHAAWLDECRRRMSARAKLQRSETRCRKCGKLLEEYSSAVESFSLAVRDYWTGGTAGAFLSVTQQERHHTEKSLADYRKALLEHYASCADHKKIHDRVT
jgi:hypothetical protein